MRRRECDTSCPHCPTRRFDHSPAMPARDFAVANGSAGFFFAARKCMKSLSSFRVLGVSILAAAALAAATPASAQYFGQNKVQYRQLDFKVLHTQHFDIY